MNKELKELLKNSKKQITEEQRSEFSNICEKYCDLLLDLAETNHLAPVPFCLAMIRTVKFYAFFSNENFKQSNNIKNPGKIMLMAAINELNDALTEIDK